MIAGGNRIDLALWAEAEKCHFALKSLLFKRFAKVGQLFLQERLDLDGQSGLHGTANGRRSWSNSVQNSDSRNSRWH